MYNMGIIAGRGDNLSDPESPTNRAEAATVLLKLAGAIRTFD